VTRAAALGFALALSTPALAQAPPAPAPAATPRAAAEALDRLGYQLGQKVHVTIGKTALDLPFARTFSDVAPKQPLLFIDSREKVSFAVNLGSFAAEYHVKPPASILILRLKQ